jgi:hypothetical protein
MAVALVRLKSGGKTYEVGDEVPSDLEDLDTLKANGSVGTAADAKKVLQAQADREANIATTQQAATEAQLAADEAALAEFNAQAQTESVTDQEAAALNAPDDEKKIGK